MTIRKTTLRRARRVLLGLAALAICLLIAACGSSSTSSSANNTSTTVGANRAAFVKCLQQHGVTPPPGARNGGPSRTHTGPPPGGRPGFGNANPARQAAFKACGATGQRAKAP